MTSKTGRGSLFFSKEQPEVSGYLVINGEDYAIVGWHCSPIRADFTATRITGGDHDRSGARAGKRDTP